MGCIQSRNDSVEVISYQQRSRKVNNDAFDIGAAARYAKDMSTSLGNIEVKPDNVDIQKKSENVWVTGHQRSVQTIPSIVSKYRFPLWKKYDKCSFCVVSNRRRASCDEDFIQITRQMPGKHLLCKKCAKEGALTKTNNNRHSHGIETLNVASFANLLALTALDLTAPASDAILKNRKNSWIQLAGHPGSFAPAGPNTIWKKRIAKENYETKAYEALVADSTTEPIIPLFSREVEYNGEFFIEMEDLLQHFNDPNIMDIKMGKRTFLESEVKNPVLRKDLYEKMVKLDPDAPTQAERDQEAITKLRYMQFRERESSTADYGFRVEAIRMSGEEPNTHLKKVKTSDQVKNTIIQFINEKPGIATLICRRLKDIRERFEKSKFFKNHEIIGSSLLFLYDRDGRAGVWLIDFAKTIPVVAKTSLNHRSPWLLDNHEDGFLCGLDNLIDIFSEIEARQSSEGVIHNTQT